MKAWIKVTTREDGDFRPRQVRKLSQNNPERCAFSKSEVRQLVEKGLLQLPAAKYRVVVILRDIQQLSADEVSRQLEAPACPCSKDAEMLLRGRLMMREWLSPHFTVSTEGAAPNDHV